MSKKKPFGFAGIIPKTNLLDTPVHKTVYEILMEAPTELNEVGFGIFCLPADAIISLPKFVNSWITSLPNGLVFSGQNDPDDVTHYEMWFNKDVVCISDGAGDRETRFLLLNDSEITIRLKGIEYLVTARKTREEVQHWIQVKTVQLLSNLEQEPS